LPKAQQLKNYTRILAINLPFVSSEEFMKSTPVLEKYHYEKKLGAGTPRYKAMTLETGNQNVNDSRILLKETHRRFANAKVQESSHNDWKQMCRIVESPITSNLCRILTMNPSFVPSTYFIKSSTILGK